MSERGNSPLTPAPKVRGACRARWQRARAALFCSPGPHSPAKVQATEQNVLDAGAGARARRSDQDAGTAPAQRRGRAVSAVHPS